MLNSGPFHETRLAPTPIGYLHLGNIFSFSLVALLAEPANASILLRIDDLEHLRVKSNYLDDIFETLRFFDIPRHTGPFNPNELKQSHSQLHRMPLYKKALNTLIEKRLIYACNCSRTEIMTNGSKIYPGTCRYKKNSVKHPKCRLAVKYRKRFTRRNKNARKKKALKLYPTK